MMSTGLIYLVVGIAITATVSATMAMHRRQQFNDRWPSISDEEFVARCHNTTDRETALRVRKIVAEQLDLPYDRIHPDQSIVDLAD